MRATKSLAERSLSTKLLLLTVLFVLIAELVVMIPSVSNQRISWLEARIESAYLVSLALEGPREAMLDENVARQLFSTANILGVTINEGDMRLLILAPEIDPHGPPKMLRVDLSESMMAEEIADAWLTMFTSGDELMQVSGTPRADVERTVDIIVSQRALRENLLIYARNILGLSLVISSLTAALMYWTLNRMIVRPVKRVTENMMAFEADPDHAGMILEPSGRSDEIGAAEKSLAAMERTIYELLNERRRLAALGAGISKISHDLRNILASAQLMSDRLAKSDDPRVRKLSPRLISALDRAITLSRDTLAFGRMESRALRKETLNLRDLVDEVFDDTAAMGVTPFNEIPEDLTVYADRTQLYRSLFNLVRNSVEAISPAPTGETEMPSSEKEEGTVTIVAERAGEAVIIRIADTGAGVPDHARAELFEPFKGSQKPGGSGLGVAISAEIIRAHGGDLILERTGIEGTTFKIVLPADSEDQSGVSTSPVSQTPSRRGSAPPS